MTAPDVTDPPSDYVPKRRRMRDINLDDEAAPQPFADIEAKYSALPDVPPSPMYLDIVPPTPPTQSPVLVPETPRDHRQPGIDALAGVVVGEENDDMNLMSAVVDNLKKRKRGRPSGSTKAKGRGRPKADAMPVPPIDVGGFNRSPRKPRTVTGRVRRYRYWMVTVNTHDVNMLNRLASVVTPEGKISYLQVQKEYGQENWEEPYQHFQCYLEARVKLSHMEVNIELGCRALGFNAHCDVRRGTQDEAVIYCGPFGRCTCSYMLRHHVDAFDTPVDASDEGLEHGKGQCPTLRMGEEYLWSWGRLSGGQGMRSDLLDLIKRVDSGAMMRDILRDTDTLVTVARHTNYLQLLVATKETRTPKPNITLTDMQKKLAKRLLEGKVRPGNVRGVVHWVWSYSSATGKSTFLDYIASQTNVVIGCEKWGDTIHSIQDDTKVVWFNLPRSTTVGEFKKYYLKQFECLSDGGLMADPKYTSHTKRVDVHVVVSCNMCPYMFRKLLPDRIEAWEFAVLTGTSVGHRRNLDTAIDREKAHFESESTQDGVDITADDYAPREMGDSGLAASPVADGDTDDSIYFDVPKPKSAYQQPQQVHPSSSLFFVARAMGFSPGAFESNGKEEKKSTAAELKEDAEVSAALASVATRIEIDTDVAKAKAKEKAKEYAELALIDHVDRVRAIAAVSAHITGSSSSTSTLCNAPVSLHGTTLGVRRGPAKPKVRKSVADEYAMSDEEETPLHRRCPTLGCSNLITGSHTRCRYHWSASRTGKHRVPIKTSCDSCDKLFFPHHVHKGTYRNEPVQMCSKCSSVCGDCGKRIWRAKQRRCGACWAVLGQRRRKGEESSSSEED